MLALGGRALRQRSAAAAGALLIMLGLALPGARVAGDFVHVIVSDKECTRVSTESFSLFNVGTLLISECTNPIRIIDLVGCEQGSGTTAAKSVPPCTVGLVIDPGLACQLPSCPD